MHPSDYYKDFVASNGFVFDACYVSDAPRCKGWTRCEWLWFELGQQFIYAGRKIRVKDRTLASQSGLEELLRLDPGQVLGFTPDGDPLALTPPKVSGSAPPEEPEEPEEQAARYRSLSTL